MNSDIYQPRHSLHQGKYINDSFFPNIDLLDLQKRHRLDPSLTLEELHGAIEEAVLLINNDLQSWVCSKTQQGYFNLEQVPDISTGLQPLGESIPQERSRLVSLYESAVSNRIKGDIARDKANAGMTQEAMRRSESYYQKTNDYYRRSVWAIRQIKGKRTTRARLL